jgi:hypothetical protein
MTAFHDCAASKKNEPKIHRNLQKYPVIPLVDTKNANTTTKAPYLFHFSLSFVKSDVGKPE